MLGTRAASAAAASAGAQFSDDFNRADGALGSNWNQYNEAGWEWGTASIAANRTSGGARLSALWSTAVDTDNQFAQVDWYTAGGETYGPIICAPASYPGGYRLFAMYWYGGFIELQRNGVAVASVGPAGSWAAVEQFRIERSGAVVKVFRNGTEIISYTDATPLTGRRVGFGTHGDNAGVTVHDNWSAGDL